MKTYRTHDQLKLVGKAWEVRTYLQREVSRNQKGHITLNDWLPSPSRTVAHIPSVPKRF